MSCSFFRLYFRWRDAPTNSYFKKLDDISIQCTQCSVWWMLFLLTLQVTELLSALEALLKNEDDIGNICLSVGRTTEAKIESMTATQWLDEISLGSLNRIGSFLIPSWEHAVCVHQEVWGDQEWDCGSADWHLVHETDHRHVPGQHAVWEIEVFVLWLKAYCFVAVWIWVLSDWRCRNFLLRLNLHIALTALSCTGATLICSIFGMNLTRYDWLDPHFLYVQWFRARSAVVLCGSHTDSLLRILLLLYVRLVLHVKVC